MITLNNRYLIKYKLIPFRRNIYIINYKLYYYFNGIFYLYFKQLKCYSKKVKRLDYFVPADSLTECFASRQIVKVAVKIRLRIYFVDTLIRVESCFIYRLHL